MRFENTFGFNENMTKDELNETLLVMVKELSQGLSDVLNEHSRLVSKINIEDQYDSKYMAFTYNVNDEDGKKKKIGITYRYRKIKDETLQELFDNVIRSFTNKVIVEKLDNADEIAFELVNYVNSKLKIEEFTAKPFDCEE